MVCDLQHRRRVAGLCMLNKIYSNSNHAIEAALPWFRLPTRRTRMVISVHFKNLDVTRSPRVKIRMTFFLACAKYWNSLDEPCFADDGVTDSKCQINCALLFC